MTLEQHVRDIPGHWIGGTTSTETAPRLDIVSPLDGAVVATAPLGTAADVDRAVRAARAALPGWSATAPAERARILERLADELQARQEDIAQAVTSEIGAPISLARAAHAGFPVLVTRAIASLADEVGWREEVGNSVIVREPVGVVGALTPWNFPLQQVVTKVVPAILAGNTVVLKPAESAPLTAPILAEAAQAAGLPDGVLNIVYGLGGVVGEAISRHPDIDMVSFTGSTAVGRQVMIAASDSLKRVALELGGKAANIVLPDADLDHALSETLAYGWTNSGQACGAWTRLLVPADRHDEAVTRLVELAADYTVGDPWDETTRIGPLASEAHWERVNRYLEQGVDDGLDLVYGGPGRVPGLEAGAFIRPTIFAGVDPASRLAQEEIFGPVLVVIPYGTEDEAVEIANGTVYGLTAAVFGEPEHALAVAGRLEVGQVYVNGATFNPLAPFGGRKQSGGGREMGRAGVEEFTELKAVQR
ncbi:aldehyde dehydrogenase family protein [Nocardioides sp. CER19]|uniref:aldehyde dehydrogenase family protein n=1 Tax=Nocardioides sp. CER19 TaxID=3038538 RepID=UPI002449A6E4|nr:aldehyde dehydrogenase family protein [Nocardioides sp. CER19]MDH2414421.1 aldehyde dehydrogenase family protein [Nocardioides sp. CER19]